MYKLCEAFKGLSLTTEQPHPHKKKLMFHTNIRYSHISWLSYNCTMYIIGNSAGPAQL